MESVIQAQGKLIGVSGAYRGMEFLVNKQEYLIGRHSECDLVLKESTISSRHAQLQFIDGKYRLVDLDSTNGTYINGEKIKDGLVRHNDRIQFDVYEFVFSNPEDVTRTIVSAIPKDLRKEEAQATMTIPKSEEPKVPVTVIEKPTVMAETREKDTSPGTVQGGSLLAGVLIGLIVAAVISIGGNFLVSQAQSGLPAGMASTMFKNILLSFPLAHLHTLWIRAAWGVVTVLSLLALLLGPLVAGWIGAKVSRRRGFTFSLLFASLYAAILVGVQLLVLEFNMEAWLNGYAIAGLGLSPAFLNLAATLAYFIGVVFILHLVGSLFARKQ